MKTFWTVLSYVLLIHFLAAVGFVVWLYQDGRLDRERLERATQIFAQRIDEEKASAQEQKARQARETAAAQEAARLERVADGPAQLSQKIAEDQERDEIALQRLERLRREIQDLQHANELARRLLTEERARLDAERKAFAQFVDAENRKRSDTDFLQTVKVYEQLKARQAKEMFQQLLQKDQADQVLDYLAAMQMRKAAAVLKEFKAPNEVAQAADLIQRLRSRGVNLTVEKSGGKSLAAPAGNDS
jgi:hypothetical protein